MEMLPLSHYQPAEEVVVDLAYIMTARLPPSHADESGSWIQAYLLTPTSTSYCCSSVNIEQLLLRVAGLWLIQSCKKQTGRIPRQS